jgi:hypothetical protein
MWARSPGRVTCSLSPQVCVSLAVAAAIRRQLHLQVKILGNIVNLIIFQGGKWGHSALRAPLLDHLSNFIALLIVQNYHRAHQIRPLRTARAVAVARRTVLFIKRFTQFCRRRIRRWPEPEKLSRGLRSTAAPAAPSTTAASGRRTRIRLLRRQMRHRQYASEKKQVSDRTLHLHWEVYTKRGRRSVRTDGSNPACFARQPPDKVFYGTSGRRREFAKSYRTGSERIIRSSPGEI